MFSSLLFLSLSLLVTAHALQISCHEEVEVQVAPDQPSWFEFMLKNESLVTFSTCNSPNIDTILRLQSLSDPAFEALFCDDAGVADPSFGNSCGTSCNPAARLTVEALPAGHYNLTVELSFTDHISTVLVSWETCSSEGEAPEEPEEPGMEIPATIWRDRDCGAHYTDPYGLAECEDLIYNQDCLFNSNVTVGECQTFEIPILGSYSGLVTGMTEGVIHASFFRAASCDGDPAQTKHFNCDECSPDLYDELCEFLHNDAICSFVGHFTVFFHCTGEVPTRSQTASPSVTPTVSQSPISLTPSPTVTPSASSEEKKGPGPGFRLFQATMVIVFVGGFFYCVVSQRKKAKLLFTQVQVASKERSRVNAKE